VNVNYWLKVHIHLKMNEFDLAMVKNKIHLTWRWELYDICIKIEFRMLASCNMLSPFFSIVSSH